ncbi:hypothetical protein [Nocardioides pacificus]
MSESHESAGRTGLTAVDAVLDSLTRLDELSLEEHVGVYEAAHEQLRRSLDTRPHAAMRPDSQAGS